MALVNTITIDLVAGSAVLNSTSSGSLVENISYSNVLNQITFASRSDIVISGVDFMTLINQINILQTAILFNFSPNVSATVPYGSLNVKESHDIINGKWTLACTYGASPSAVNYSADLATITLDLQTRSGSKTLDFPEWIQLLSLLIQYRLSVRNFFSL